MASFSPMTQQHVVSLSFHEATFSKTRREFIKRNHTSSIFELEVIGELHTFEDIAEALFSHYLSAVRGGDELDDHLWRFEPVGLEEAFGATVALDSNKPILSCDMKAREPYEMGMVKPIACQINEGFEMIFFYDEGSSTRVAVTVDSIEPLDSSTFSAAVTSFPKVKGAGDIGAAHSDGTKEQLTADNNVMDSLFLPLQNTVFDPAYGKCFFGSCRHDMHGAIEAGTCQNGDQVYCPLQFSKFEDFLILMNKATELLREAEDTSKTRSGWTNVIIFPPEPQAPAEEERITHTLSCFARIARFVAEMDRGPLSEDDGPTEEESYMMCGPSMIGLRLSMADTDKERAKLRTKGVDMSVMFPAMTTAFSKPNDKHLHFSLERVNLTVASKMKKGDDRVSKQILLHPQKKFASLHDAFSVVEEFLRDSPLLSGKAK